MVKSATNIWVNVFALVLSSVALYLLLNYSDLANNHILQLTALVLFIPMAISEFTNTSLHRRQVSRHAISVTLFKSLGVYLSFGFVGFCYWLLPEYSGSFYDKFYQLIWDYGLYVVLATPFYVRWVSERDGELEDSYYQLGRCFSGVFRLDREIMKHHFLGWVVKGFFYPLMYTYAMDKINWLRHLNIDIDTISFFQFYDISLGLLYYVDLIFVVVGYLCTLKIFGAHIRTVQTTLFGWSVALACYQPFWSLLSSYYIEYENELFWNNWLHDYGAIYYIWGGAILLCITVYSLATVAFGMRFSNLTHRGIITAGPYRWTKHPAYISKNLSWWLISVPFVYVADWQTTVKCCLSLLMLNFIYYMRAKTEERHLNEDPVYQQYSRDIAQRGLLARFKSPAK